MPTTKQESASAATPVPSTEQSVRMEDGPISTAALQTQVSSIPIASVGSALRKGANGEVLGPRIVERKPKIKVRLFFFHAQDWVAKHGLIRHRR